MGVGVSYERGTPVARLMKIEAQVTLNPTPSHTLYRSLSLSLSRARSLPCSLTVSLFLSLSLSLSLSISLSRAHTNTHTHSLSQPHTQSGPRGSAHQDRAGRTLGPPHRDSIFFISQLLTPFFLISQQLSQFLISQLLSPRLVVDRPALRGLPAFLSCIMY